ncbi:MAG: arylesterase [Zoogloea sp.]|nr:arylesterase [Zoogloea sp.]
MSLRSIVLVCLLWCCTFAAQAATILVWGDSLSAGYGLRTEEAWPTLLIKRLKEFGYSHSVVNASISGETSAGGRSRLPLALKQHKPQVVILELGANDGLRGLPVASMRDNLEDMIRNARGAGAKVLLVGMRMPPNYGPAYTEKFQSTFAELAERYRLGLVPFMMDGFADKPGLFQADGLHPVAAAQPRILDNIWPQLAPLLRK